MEGKRVWFRNMQNVLKSFSCAHSVGIYNFSWRSYSEDIKKKHSTTTSNFITAWLFSEAQKVRAKTPTDKTLHLCRSIHSNIAHQSFHSKLKTQTINRRPRWWEHVKKKNPKEVSAGNQPQPPAELHWIYELSQRRCLSQSPVLYAVSSSSTEEQLLNTAF